MKRDPSAPQRLLALVLPLPDGAQEADTSVLSEDARVALATQFEGQLCVIEVLKRGPKTREAWEAHTKEWPLIFHASVAAEQQDEELTEHDAATMKELVRRAKQLATGDARDDVTGCCALGCLIVDPAATADHRIVADSSHHHEKDGAVFHPIFHGVMRALDGVARRDRERETAKQPRRDGDSDAGAWWLRWSFYPWRRVLPVHWLRRVPGSGALRDVAQWRWSTVALAV
ncbi:hypothetical protein PINS_up021355 [Pythium insidiosum]|nr:hypothetical protein PINS_up021355 [Pythium insidiosum]